MLADDPFAALEVDPPKKGLIESKEFSKVAGSKAPRLTFQGQADEKVKYQLKGLFDEEK
jgi:hypothetical protein